MNFFGHAVVARRRRDAPAFVLGAMLPDFATMSGARLARVDHLEVAAGVEHHHAADAAFHRAPAFRALNRRGVGELTARGVPRGGALGAAHVGIELLLDGVLLDDELACASYRDALEIAATVDDELVWHTGEGRRRWRDVRDRLHAHGVPAGYRDPAVVADRIARILSRRPLLALGAASLPAVEDWLRELQPAVVAAAPALVAAACE